MTKKMPTTNASTIGQPDPDGMGSTSSKWPSRTVLACVAWPWSRGNRSRSSTSQFGYGLDTLGMTAKLYGGGGDGVVHPRVPPWNGSGPAGTPRRRLQKRLAKIITRPAVSTKEPIVSARLYESQPNPEWYV